MNKWRRFVAFLGKPAELYHSKDEKYGSGMKFMAVVFAIVTIIFGWLTLYDLQIQPDNIFETIILNFLRYMFYESMFLFFFSVTTHFYIYGEKNKSSLVKVLFIVYYYALCVTAFLSLIPVAIIMATVNKIASYRAKKIDNLQCVWLIFVLDLYIVYFTGIIEMKTGFIECIYSFINYFIKLNSMETQLFLFLGIVEFLSLKINRLICEIIYKTRKSKIENKDNNEANNTTVKTCKTEEQLIGETDLEYDKDYQIKTLLKTHIFSLVLLGLAAIFLNYKEIKEVSTGLINVVTCFTLIILLYDKRVELGKIKGEHVDSSCE